jgi:hypothetical protein
VKIICWSVLLTKSSFLFEDFLLCWPCLVINIIFITLQQLPETGEDRDVDVENNWTARIPPGKGVDQPHKFQATSLELEFVLCIFLDFSFYV